MKMWKLYDNDDDRQWTAEYLGSGELITGTWDKLDMNKHAW